MLVWLCVPFIHLQLAFQLNLAASGALLSASRAPSSASTLTPFWTCFSVSVLIFPPRLLRSMNVRQAAIVSRPCIRPVSVAMPDCSDSPPMHGHDNSVGGCCWAETNQAHGVRGLQFVRYALCLACRHGQAIHRQSIQRRWGPRGHRRRRGTARRYDGLAL